MTSQSGQSLAESGQPAWADDTPVHALLSRHPVAPLIETSASKVIAKPLDEVFLHFWGSDPRLRLELHRDHVKGYSIHRETPDSLEYEFVFEAYGTRSWGKAVEVAQRNRPAAQGGPRIDVEVLDGPLKGQTVTTLFRAVAGGTEVTQINRVWPGDSDLMVKILGKKLNARLTALAGVHLEQHRHDLEGLERFQDRFSQEHQEKLAHGDGAFVDFLKTTRAVTLPVIILPILGAAALAARQGVFDPSALVLTLVGGGAALLAANLLNDLYDFKGGADQSARQVPGAIETGSGAFVEGRWSLKKGWAMTVALFGVAALCGLALAVFSTPLVLAFAAAGALISYIYIGPPFPLAYKGRGLGELCIFVAFGLLPVAGGVLAHGGTLTHEVWAIASFFGLSSMMLLYHHHFLHWEADRVAGKGSPVAILGPQGGALVGMGLALGTSAAILATVLALGLEPWTALAAAPPLLLLPQQRKVLAGSKDPPQMLRQMNAAFGAMMLIGLNLVLGLWLTA
ncbi:MAG: prenyltransferase [Candidatus Thermoplasmatota archaeon]|jgi:1,4-dihydroxy-2-naphthoate octaprenyltransferase